MTLEAKIIVSADFINLLKACYIFTSPDPNFIGSNGTGWLKIGGQLALSQRVELESNCGIYEGPYRGLTGWQTAKAGFCTIGCFSYSASPLPSGLTIGRYCSIGPGVHFMDVQHSLEYITTSPVLTSRDHIFAQNIPNREQFQPVAWSFSKQYPVIENDVWGGCNACLAMGIRIGTGAVIAAELVVTKDVPPYAIVAGNPAQIKKYRFSESAIEALLASRWWDYLYTDLSGMDFRNPEVFAAQIAERKASDHLRNYIPKRLLLPDMVIIKGGP